MRGYPGLSEHELRTTLCRIAAEHQPDRTAMLTRIAQHRPGLPVADRQPAGHALRLAGSALAVATILGVGGVARWALADGPDPGVVPVAPPIATWSPPVATAPTTEAPPTEAPATNRPRAAKSSSSVPHPPPAAPRPPATEPLWVDGSVNPNTDDTEGRSDLTLEVREPLTTLRLTVRVAPTAGLTEQGSTHDAGAAVTGTVVREQETLVYTFELAAGAELDVGTYVLTAKYAYDNEGGRDAGADTWQVTAATAVAAGPIDLRGDFY